MKVTGPLHSNTTKGRFGEHLTFSMRNGQQIARFQKKQKDVLTGKRADTRSMYLVILAFWKAKSTAKKEVFNAEAKVKNLSMSGWNYFFKLASESPITYLGLKFYLPMNSHTGAVLPDISKNGNNGTLGTAYPTNCPTEVDGKNTKVLKAYRFDGGTNRITIPNFPLTKVEFAISFNFQNHAYTGSNGLIDFATYLQYGFEIMINATNTIFARFNWAGAMVQGTPIHGILFDTWYNLFAQYYYNTTTSKYEMHFYLDNVFKLKLSSTIPMKPPPVPFTIGSRDNTSLYGKMGNVLFFEKKLSDSERTNIFNAFK